MVQSLASSSLRFQDSTFRKRPFAAISGWARNFSAQMGARTAMTAVSARVLAIFSAVPPVTQPNPAPAQLNPTATVKTNPIAAP